MEAEIKEGKDDYRCTTSTFQTCTDQTAMTYNLEVIVQVNRTKFICLLFTVNY